eukprot:CAMPEP_0169424790 /NCGR_PEP_ID=MMETSP1017-20121227/68223_1 /TAXON_ID=342587 /ORGANISM="Karlodinium micrum, Strain CCMP2283" /LENGTH=803 /DNA_ID=CAMNT_0009534587 /DNA_START=31 /DNA_END=2443 /DNA_ORIENTATION=-
MPSLFGGRKKAHVVNGVAAPNTKSCWSQVEEAESAPHPTVSRASPRHSLAFGFAEEPPQPPSLPRVPKPPKMPPPSLAQLLEKDSGSKVQKLEQKSEIARKSRRPSSASRATAAVSAAWTAARAALNSSVSSPRASLQHKDSKGQKVSRGPDTGAYEKDARKSFDESQICPEALQQRIVDTSISNSGMQSRGKELCDEQLELKALTSKLVLATLWVLPGSDGDLIVCYANTNTDEVMEAPPLLESFAELAKLAVHAIVNPHIDEASASEFYYCTSTGCSSWTSPAAAHAYVAHVAQQLLHSHIFPEHIEDSDLHENEQAGTLKNRRREVRPDKVDAHSGYSREQEARRSDGHRQSRDNRLRKPRSSPSSSHKSISVESDVNGSVGNHSTTGSSNFLKPSSSDMSGYVGESAASRRSRKHQHYHENRSRRPRPSLVSSNVSESFESDVTCSSAATSLPLGSRKPKQSEGQSDPMFFEIYSDESAGDDDEDDDSASCESVRPEHFQQIQKQKRPSSSNVVSNKAAAALAGAAAALSAAAVALAGLEKHGRSKEAVNVDSLLAAASALRLAGPEAPPMVPSMGKATRKRPTRASGSKAQPGIPRLALDKLSTSDTKEVLPNGDAATGRYTLSRSCGVISHCVDDAHDNEECPNDSCDVLRTSDESEAPPSGSYGYDIIDEAPRSKPSASNPLPAEGAFIDASTLLDYAEEAAAGDTPTSSITSETLLHAERQEAMALAESALQAAFEHVSESSNFPAMREETQQPDEVPDLQASTHTERKHEDEMGKVFGDLEPRGSRKKVTAGGA